MKKIYLILYLSVFFLSTNYAQIVFCPPGAEWHFSYKLWDQPQNNFVTTIKYDRDTVINQDTLKILKHVDFDLTVYTVQHKYTLIKQRGDTIFMNNFRTNNNWEILYNFATVQGQSWLTNYNVHGGAMRTYSFTVDSINYEIVNGFNLKNLFVKVVSTVNLHGYNYSSFKISERFGCTKFMFMFGNEGYNDNNWISAFLCYQDNAFGLKQFTNNACNYTNVGVQQFSVADNSIKIYPNPAKDWLMLESDSEHFFTTNQVDLVITDVLGLIVKKLKLTQQTKVDMSDLKAGIYLLTISDMAGKTYTHKILKE